MRTGLLLATAALLLALAGCVPTGPGGSPSPSAHATPVFASDAEALAAAEKAYAAYLKVSDQILHDGGQDPDRLLTVATRSVYQNEADGYASARNAGFHSKGDTTFDHMALQSFDGGSAENAVSVYVCTDISDVDILDASGKSVVSPSRPDKTAFEVSFDVSSHGALIVSDKQVWGGGGVCS